VDDLEGFRASPSYSSGILTPEQYRKKLMRLIRDYEDGIESFDEPMPPEDYENMRALAEKLGFI
jgi:L-alanine-DL-glutamate epimerase-like enolase superfamily enzyme